MKSDRGSQSILGIFGIVTCSALALVLAQAAGTLVEQRQLGNLANAVALDAADLLRNDPDLQADESSLRVHASSTLVELASDPRGLDVLRPRVTRFSLEHTQRVLLTLCADSRFANSPVTALLPKSLSEVCVAAAAQNVQQDNF